MKLNKNPNREMTYSVISCGLWGHRGQRSHRTGRYRYLRPLVIREIRWIRLVHDISATHDASPQSRKDIQKFWHSITEYANERDNVITNKQKCQSTIALQFSAVWVLLRKYRVLGWLLSSFLFATGLLDFEATPSTRHGRLGEGSWRNSPVAKCPCWVLGSRAMIIPMKRLQRKMLWMRP